jgi:hypothetical protein
VIATVPGIDRKGAVEDVRISVESQGDSRNS